MKKSSLILLVILTFVNAKGQGLYLDSLLLKPVDSSLFSSNEWYWTKITLHQSTDYAEIQGWGEIIAYEGDNILKTGLNLRGNEKSYYSYRNIIQSPKGELLIKLKGNHPLFELNSASIIEHSSAGWRFQERQRLIAHGLFFGILIVMALYNLMIFFAVKDQSYLWYVLSIIGFGLYMAYYYGFTYEHFWSSQPHWNSYFFALIIPLTNLSRIQFTKTYLHTDQYVAKWHFFFKGMLVLYLIPITMWLISWLEIREWLIPTNHVIGFLGSITMTSITIVSVIVYRRGYKPALWFLIAYILFNIGGVLFIFRELYDISDNFLTRYVIQIGAVAQVVLFSLGLSDRLNRTRKMLATQTIEKEKIALEREMERKALIERQKDELEKLVKDRTKELEKTLTQLRLSEKELRELNEVKSKLFSIISHELKSPLTTVDSYLNLLIKHYNKLSPEEISELSDKTRFSLQNLTMLMDNLLLWSRLQQNNLSFNPVEVDLRKVVDKSIRLFILLIEQKHIKLEVDHEIDEAILYADKDMIEFVVRNLLHNSIKFTPKNGKIKLSASCDNGLSRINISDTGIGMTSEMINQILIENQNLTRNGTEQEKGSGIGLIMCKDFVEKNGGKLEIKAGKGTKVSFSIPLYK